MSKDSEVFRIENVNTRHDLGFVWELGGKGRGGLKIYRKMDEKFTFFLKNSFLENNKLVLFFFDKDKLILILIYF